MLPLLELLPWLLPEPLPWVPPELLPVLPELLLPLLPLEEEAEDDDPFELLWSSLFLLFSSFFVLLAMVRLLKL